MVADKNGNPEGYMIERTLIIRAEALEMILDGTKHWEIRSRPTRINGRIALSEKGANAIVGTCTVDGVKGALTIEQVLKHARRMGSTRAEVEADLSWWRRECQKQRVFAWVLCNVRRLRHPVPFANPSGAVTWARLPERIARQLR
jgi:predicted transcriptional regulator